MQYLYNKKVCVLCLFVLNPEYEYNEKIRETIQNIV